MKKIFYLFIITSFIFTSCKKEKGCTDSLAYNYNIDAEEDDGSCVYDGCTDSTACNYISNATINTNCDYDCIGCTDVLATNYDSLATINNGDCIFSISGGSWIAQSQESNGNMTITYMGMPFLDSTINYIETNPDSLEPYKLIINDDNTYTEFDQSNNSIEDGTWSLSGDKLTINTPDTTYVLTIILVEKNSLSMNINFVESDDDEGFIIDYNITQTLNFNREW